MAWGDTIFEVEQIEKLPLIAFLLTHHDPPPSLNESSKRESCGADDHEAFFDSIGQSRHFDDLWVMSVLTPTTDIRAHCTVGRKVPLTVIPPMPSAPSGRTATN